jgi:hypothetical protein
VYVETSEIGATRSSQTYCGEADEAAYDDEVGEREHGALRPRRRVHVAGQTRTSYRAITG